MKKIVTIFDPLGHAFEYCESMASIFVERGYLVDLNVKTNFPKWRLVALPLKLLFLYFNLLKVLISAKQKPHPIFFNFLHFPILDGMVVRLLGGPHCHLIVHNLLANHNEGSVFYRLGYNFLLRSFSKFVAHTDEIALALTSLVPKTSVIVRANIPAALRTASDSDKPLSLSMSDFILFFGTVRPYKGLDILIDAIEGNEYLNQPTFRLVVAGRFSKVCKPLKQRLEGLQANVEIFDKRVTDGEIEVLFSASMAVVMPYRHIDGSGVFAQARSFKKPVIASRIGIFNEKINHRDTGLLFEVGSKKDLSLVLEEFWSCEQTRLMLAKNCDEIDDPTWSDFVETLETEFDLTRGYDGYS